MSTHINCDQRPIRLLFVMTLLLHTSNAFTFLHNVANPNSAETSSNVVVEIVNQTLTANYLSFTLRTLQENGIICLLEIADMTSMTVEIHDGDLILTKGTQYRVPYWKRLSDGLEYGIKISITSTEVAILVDDFKFISTIKTWNPSANRLQKIILGTPESTALTNLNLKTDQKFKGCLSAVEIGIEDQQPLSVTLDISSQAATVTQTNVEEGCINDVICASLTSDPCQNGATCEDGFNDYKCANCPNAFYGKNCDLESFCGKSGQHCQDSFVCLDVGSTFECSGVATFSTNSYVLITPQDGVSGNVVSLEFSIQSRQAQGVILYVTGDNCFFTVEMIAGGCIGIRSSSISGTVEFECNLIDGENHKILLEIQQQKMELRIEEEPLVERSYSGSFFDMSCSNKVLIGGLKFGEIINTNHFMSDDPQSVNGCLEDVRLNGALLPFFFVETENGYVMEDDSGVVSECSNLNMCDPKFPPEDTCNTGQCNVINSEWRGFRCDCSNTGYVGDNCEVEIDECEVNPCVRGPCTDLINDFNCTCPAGYEGKRCADDINECAICENDPDVPCNGLCSNAATCQNTEGSFSCQCVDFWLGNVCEDGTKCPQNPCIASKTSKCNNLNSVESDGRQFECDCKNGYRGTVCDETDYCANQNCNGNGQCSNTGTAFQCQCDEGWEGDECERDIDECLDDPCTRGFAEQDCENTAGGYDCHCIYGYSLPNCDSIRDFCDDRPCLNGAACTSTDFVGYNCTCLAGFEGADCEINIDECANNDCSGKSKCVDGINSYTCNCDKTGFKGVRCDEPCVNEEPCKNGGTCLANGTDFYCSCSSEYEGNTCTSKLKSDSASTAATPLLIAGILLIFILVVIIGLLVMKHYKKTRVSTGTYRPKSTEGSDNSIPKMSEFPEFQIPRARTERLI